MIVQIRPVIRDKPSDFEMSRCREDIQQRIGVESGGRSFVQIEEQEHFLRNVKVDVKIALHLEQAVASR